MEAVAFDDVTYSYDGLADVLDGLTLSIAPGERVAVLGPNGCGKSTLARCIDALVVPDAGTVRVLGVATSSPEGARAARRRAGMVFQNPDDQLVTSVVADDVAFGPENLGLPQPSIAERVDEALAAVGMAASANADPAELSGGQRQRVAIAGVLAMDPQVVVFDESTAMLDPQGRADVLRIVAGLAERGVTVIQVTHFMEEALDADRVLVVDGGRIVLEGTPDEVFSHAEELEALGLDLPFPLQLACALRARGVDVAPTCRIDELEEALWRSSSSR